MSFQTHKTSVPPFEVYAIKTLMLQKDNKDTVKVIHINWVV